MKNGKLQFGLRCSHLLQKTEKNTISKNGKLVYISGNYFYDQPNFHCSIRILPHQQNTGGFFVAVIEKLKHINTKEKKSSNQAEVDCNKKECKQTDNAKRPFDETLPENQRKRRRKEGYKEDPFIFLEDDEKVWPDIKNYYEISDEFDVKCLLVRCHEGKRKNIYLTSAAVRDLVLQNKDVIKFINTGVKCFVRSDNRNMKCAFRIANDGLESIFSYIGDSRKVRITKEDLITLLLNTDPRNAPKIENLSDFVKKQVENLSPGSCILIYNEEDEGKEPFYLHISGWRGTNSLRSYMSQHGTVHILRLLEADTSKYGKLFYLSVQ